MKVTRDIDEESGSIVLYDGLSWKGNLAMTCYEPGNGCHRLYRTAPAPAPPLARYNYNIRGDRYHTNAACLGGCPEVSRCGDLHGDGVLSRENLLSVRVCPAEWKADRTVPRQSRNNSQMVHWQRAQRMRIPYVLPSTWYKILPRVTRCSPPEETYAAILLGYSTPDNEYSKKQKHCASFLYIFHSRAAEK